MEMPGRTFSSENSRFGYQKQEKDNEIKGDGNSLNFKYRMHDPRIGRFFAVDPLHSDYPWNSPYSFAENRVIDMIELEGGEMMHPIQGARQTWYGETVFQIVKFSWSAAKAVASGIGFILELPGKMHYGDRMTPAQRNAHFKFTGNKNWGEIGLDVLMTPIQAARNVYDDPTNAEKWGEAAVVAYSMRSAAKGGRAAISIIDQRINLAKSYFTKYKVENLSRHMEAIDFNSPVQTITLEKGAILYRYADITSDVPKHYFFQDPATFPGELGIMNKMYKMPANFILEKVTLEKSIKVLQSNVNLFDANSKGAKQVFSTEIQNNAKFETISP